MMRPGIFAFVIFLSTLPMTAVSAEGIERHPTVLAELQEESIPAQDLAAPSPAAGSSPAAAPSPAVEESPDSDSSDGDQSEPDDWQRVPGGKPSAAAQTLPAQKGQPAANAQTPDDDETAPSPAQNEQPAQAAPPEIAPALDAGSIATTPQVSDQSLAPLINSAPTPARAASLRITEQERIELDQGHTDDAIRELAHAISIDPSNSYAYFYLGRAYVARRDYGQAETFFKRAEIGLGANSAWLGEAYAFEGMSLEQDGKSAEAAVAYQKALAASPGNLTARVGVTRVGAVIPAAANGSAPAAPDLDQPAPAEPDPASAPDEAPVPPPPAAPAPPTD
jgi:Flp pilus assembly protein TadD